MTNCVKRSVLGAGDRPTRVAQAAADVRAATDALTQRVLPHASNNGVGWNRPLGHRPMGNGSAFPWLDLLRQVADNVATLADEVNDAITDRYNASEVRNSGTAAEARTFIQVVYQPYTEPMEIPAVDGVSIAAISCARVVVTQDPTVYLLTGAAVDWESDGNSISVRSIDGLTPGDPRVLTFTFVYFGV